MLKVYCDGGSRGNPGNAAYGYVVYKDSKIIQKKGEFLGINTNNFAEYNALINALLWISEKYPQEEIEVYLDSELVVKQMGGLYKVKNIKIRELYTQAKDLEKKISKISYTHIPREKNKEADFIVNLTLDKNES